MSDAQGVVGRYEILREIGRGGMATVHLARQVDLDRLVALKELRALRSDDDPSLAPRFLREARLAGSLSHPNIVTVYEYFEADGVPHIAMEYMAQGSLRPYVGRLAPAQVGLVLEGLLAGLAEAERHDVVHRDIKPENLLVTGEGGIKIADFGIAKATNVLEQTAHLTSTGMTVGTPNYIAPEQAMARELGPWTDLYSVGVTTFELFVGRAPFSDSQEPMAIVLRQLNEPIPPLTSVIPGADPWLSQWIEWLVAKDPARRPQSARQAWEGLEEVLIRLLGPRWRRNAQLSTAPSSPADTPSSRQTAARQTAPTRRRTGADPRLAATVAPRGRSVAASPVGEQGAPTRRIRRRRRPALAAVGTLVGVLTAAVILFGKSGGSPSTPASQGVTGVTVAAPTTTSPVAASAVPTGAAAQARALAKSYRRAQSQLAGRRGAGAAKLRAAFGATAAAYGRAARAATTGDAAAYEVALADAAVKRQAITTTAADNAPAPRKTAPATTTAAPRAPAPATNAPPVRTAPATSPPARPAPIRTAPTRAAPTRAAPTVTTRARTAPVAPPPPASCQGDSQSDDPSDDSCSP